MATPIVPKSKFRLEDAEYVRIGYGEIPVVNTPEGKKAWGLPGRGITHCLQEAKKAAARLDQLIRANLDHPNRPSLLA